MTTPETVTPREFAQRMGFKPHYGHQLAKDGRLVFAPDGKRVLLAESIARFNATKDPSRQGVADRHAAQRQAPSPADDTADDDEHARSAPTRNQAPTDTAVGSSYQQARAVKEKFLALEAKRAYEVAIGQLRDSREVEAIAATAMTELRLRLEGLASTLAPTIVAQQDEGRVRAMLQDEFARALESASNHFARLSASAGGAP